MKINLEAIKLCYVQSDLIIICTRPHFPNFSERRANNYHCTLASYINTCYLLSCEIVLRINIAHVPAFVPIINRQKSKTGVSVAPQKGIFEDYFS